MIVALIDNGSLEPAAHRNLRAVAAALAERVGVPVHAISWKHSDRIPAADLGREPAWTLMPWVRAQFARGEHEFVFVPFFVSAQGAIGSAFARDLKKLQNEGYDFAFTFTDGLAARGALAPIVADGVRKTLAEKNLSRPAVVVVDHGGPSAGSAALRDRTAGEVRALLGADVGPLAAASLEGADYPHARPLLVDALAAPGFDRGDVVVAPLFLAPGRHAGPDGDVAQICRAASARCHLSALVGDHPAVVQSLAAALRETIAGWRSSHGDAPASSIPLEAGGYVS